MGADENYIPLTYRAIQAIFTTGLKGFYNTVEVHNDSLVPPPGECTVLCPNHGNSLTDAIAVVSQSPRMVRLTAKDTLWKDKIFGWWVRNTGTVPIQRRTEHGSKTNNSESLAALYKALQTGGCVCLFPEGISRYQSGISPLKPGVGRIVIEVLKREHEAGNNDFKVNVVSCALSYLHREKFRSDLGLAYAVPVSYRAGDYPGLALGEGGETGAAGRIMQSVAKQLGEDLISAPDWDTLLAAHTARNIYAPLGTRISLHQHIKLTQRWVKVFSTMTEASRVQQGLSRSKSDPDIPALDRQFSDEECLMVSKTKEALLAYEGRRSVLGVPDNRLRRPQWGGLRLAMRTVGHALWASTLLCIAAPGTIVLSPLFGLGKYLERHLQRSNVGERQVRNMDEVAQYKLAMSVFVGPATTICAALGMHYWLRSPILVTLPAAALWLWMTVRWLEDGVASINVTAELWTMLWRQSEVGALRKERAHLMPLVESLAKAHELPTAAEIMAETPSWHRQRSWTLAYFSLRRRRKKEWGEVMHMGHIDYNYPLSVLKTQQANLRGPPSSSAVTKNGVPSAGKGVKMS